MPETITTFHDFVPGTPARANQVDENFANYRGTILPVNTNTASASNLTHNLGAADHRWNMFYGSALDLGNTTTANPIQLRSTTVNSLVIQISSTTVFQLDSTGFDGGYLQAGSVDTSTAFASGVLPTVYSKGFDANGFFTVPSGVFNICVVACGGGGGGGGGAGNTLDGGGAGGSGALPMVVWMSVTAADVLTITVGSAGNSGAGSAGATGTSGGTGGTTFVRTRTFLGAPGGEGGRLATTTSAELWRAAGPYVAGGFGGAASGNGGAGGDTMWNVGGAAGSASGGGGGGGGGAAGYDGGGSGGGGGASGSNGTSGSRGSGGGGGGGGATGSGGNGGAGGTGYVLIHWVGPGSSIPS